MGRSRPCGSAKRMQQVRARIERWRQTRAKRSPMPEALWEAAVELARSEGLHPVARGLQVSYQSLKARVAAASAGSQRATNSALPCHYVFADITPIKCIPIKVCYMDTYAQ